MRDLPEQMTDIAAKRLRHVVRAALDEPAAALGTWEATPRRGGASLASGASAIWQISGVARVRAVERSWTVMLKALRSVDGNDDPSRISYWKRERLLHEAGVLADLPGSLRAPRCHGIDDLPDGTACLWLEYVQEDGPRAWPRERWSLAARHLGQLNGAYLVGRPLPSSPWLGGRRLRSWLDRHVPLVARISAAPNNPGVRRWWPRPVVDAILRLWEERIAFCDALERLPQTFCHGDAIRRNLFARRGKEGAEETVAIDWENAGHYAAGEEVGQTLSVASAFFDVEPSDLPALDDALFGGYLEGLRDAGWRGDPTPVRFAYAAHAALRNLFNAVGASVPDDAGRAGALQNYGHTWEELAERRAVARPFLLARAAEARDLLDSL